MEPKTTAQHARQRRRLGVLALGALVLAAVAVACHASAVKHNLAIHSVTDVEEYCVDTTQSSISVTDAANFLAETLWGSQGNLEENWSTIDGTATIFWFPESVYFNNCAAMPYETWVEYRYEDGSGFSNVGHIDYVCVDGSGPLHCHFKKELVILKTPHVQNEDDGATHTINHETGHVLGLLDPHIPGDPGTPCVNCGIISDEDDNYSTCLFRDPILGQVGWIVSIMHSYTYCGLEGYGAYSLPWPHVSDRDKVIEIIEFIEQVFQ